MSKKHKRFNKDEDQFENYKDSPRRLNSKQQRALQKIQEEQESFLERAAYNRNDRRDYRD